jgi:hypothetical protein
MDSDPEIRSEGGREDRPHWLERKETGRRLFWGLVALCAALGLADFVYPRHGIFGFEEIPLAYAIFGFVCFFGIVLSGYPLRWLVGRDEDYYDR